MAEEKKSKFQLILIVVLVFFAVFAVLVFAGKINIGGGSSSSAPTGTVTLWGTIKKSQFGNMLDDFNAQAETYTLNYQYIDPTVFEKNLIEALASGTGPDLILLPDNLIIKYADKIYPLPETSFPLKGFQETFISEGGLYVGSKGILGIPLTVDPMVMYYNQSLLESAGIPLYPKTWEEIIDLVPQLTVADTEFAVTQSTAGLGEYDNITHASDLMALLMMQFGTPIVVRNNDSFVSVVNQANGTTNFKPATEAMAFYTNFSNPAQPDFYSWNKSLPQSRDMFIAGKLAMYFGYASELFYIQGKNPNLNFNVALMPQLKSSTTKLTLGRMNGIALLKSTKNLPAAYATLSSFASPEFEGNLSIMLSLPPARRDLLSTAQASPYISTFFQSALIARGWYNPSEGQTSVMMKEIISNIKSGRYTIDGAIERFNTELNLLVVKSKI